MKSVGGIERELPGHSVAPKGWNKSMKEPLFESLLNCLSPEGQILFWIVVVVLILFGIAWVGSFLLSLNWSGLITP